MPRRIFRRGMVVGALLGAAFWGGYVLISIPICVSDSACPRTWEPFLIVFVVGFTATLGVSILGFWLIHKLYLRFKDG